MTDCIFCKITANEIPSIRLFENERIFVMMDIFPESQGHSLIIPKAHYENLFEIDEAMLSEVVTVSKKIAQATKTALNADGIKIAQFNGSEAGQTVFHYHMHVVPAYQGQTMKRHASAPADSDELQGIADRIKAHLTL